MKWTRLAKSSTALTQPRPMLRPIFKASSDDAQKIEALARRYEPSLAQAINVAFRRWGSSINFNDLVAALESGSADNVLSAINVPELDQLFGDLRTQVAAGALAGGAAAAATIPKLTGAAFSFDVLNPRLIDHLRAYSFDLIQQMSNRSMDAIRQVMQEGFTTGRNPRAMATDIKSAIGLTRAQMGAVMNYRDELENFHNRRSADAFGLGNRATRVNGRQVLILDSDGNPLDGINARRLRDFRFDRTLQRAMDTGKPLSEGQVDAMVGRYRDKWVKYRAESIARTESLRALNLGVWNAWQQVVENGTVDDNLVRRQWIVAPDERTCPVCNAIADLNPEEGVMLDQPFNTPDGPQLIPPLHPNCRCTIFIRIYDPAELLQFAADRQVSNG